MTMILLFVILGAILGGACGCHDAEIPPDLQHYNVSSYPPLSGWDRFVMGVEVAGVVAFYGVILLALFVVGWMI